MTLLNKLPKKILIINIFGIGDVLFTTPLIRNLKLQYPDLSIGYVCNRRTVSVLKRLPQIDRAFVYERDAFYAVYQKSKVAFLKKLAAFIQEIKGEKYDVVIDLSMNTFTGFFAWQAGIKARTGFDYKNRGFFLNKKIALQGYEGKHVIEYYLDFLKYLNMPVDEKKDASQFCESPGRAQTKVLLGHCARPGGSQNWNASEKRMIFPITTEEEQWAESFLREMGIKEGASVIGMVPGGGASWGKDAAYKRWEAEKYAKLADKLIEKFAVEIILMGSLEEQDLCGKVSTLMQNHAYLTCGKTSIPQFAALSIKCRVNIVNDGGPLHVAVAAGAKTVSIFGPVDERVYGPYPREGHIVVKHNIACRPCYHRFRRASCTHISCLREITVEQVMEKVEELL